MSGTVEDVNAEHARQEHTSRPETNANQNSFRKLDCSPDRLPGIDSDTHELVELRQRLYDAQLADLLDKHRQEESATQYLERFLRASKGVEDAFKMLRADFEWRETNRILGLRNMQLHEVVGGAQVVELLDELLPTRAIGRDYHGRPVLYRVVSPSWSAAKFQGLGFSIISLEKWQAWIMERLLTQHERQGSSICLVDVSGLL